MSISLFSNAYISMVRFVVVLVSLRVLGTGRFGRKGTAINLVGDQKSIEVLASIEAHFSSDGKEMIQMAPPDPEALAGVIEI